MIEKIGIKNFKSIDEVNLDLARVNVIIGENGAGKSNILESIALGAAAAAGKLDNEFLVSRGIRVTKPEYMRSAFSSENRDSHIEFFARGSDGFYGCKLVNDNKPYSHWIDSTAVDDTGEIIANIFSARMAEKLTQELKSKNDTKLPNEEVEKIARNTLDIVLKDLQSRGIIELDESKEGVLEIKDVFEPPADEIFRLNTKKEISGFVVYSPENTALRTFEQEGQLEPLGVNGAGLFRLLKVMSAGDENKIQRIKQNLHVLGWFQDFNIFDDSQVGEQKIEIRDRYIDPNVPALDQKSANEGFLFLLFYNALFISDNTPKFFAIDNIDASLNPRLCAEVIRQITELAIENDKQVILTTHNPAILDGLDLSSPNHRLFIARRNIDGHTVLSKAKAPRAVQGAESVRLSEAFIRGYLGGLPKGF